MVRQDGAYFVVVYGGELAVPTLALILKEVTVHDNLVGNYADLTGLMALVVDGRLTLHTTTYSLDAAVRALDDLDHGRIRGRAVLTPGAS